MGVTLKERIELLALVRGILVYASDLLTHQTNSVFCGDREGMDTMKLIHFAAQEKLITL